MAWLRTGKGLSGQGPPVHKAAVKPCGSQTVKSSGGQSQNLKPFALPSKTKERRAAFCALPFLARESSQ